MTEYRIVQLDLLPIFRIEYWRERTWWRAGAWVWARYFYYGRSRVAEFYSLGEAREARDRFIARDREQELRRQRAWRVL